MTFLVPGRQVFAVTVAQGEGAVFWPTAAMWTTRSRLGFSKGAKLMALIDLHQLWQLGKDIYWICSCFLQDTITVLVLFELSFQQLLSSYQLLIQHWAEPVVLLPLGAGR